MRKSWTIAILIGLAMRPVSGLADDVNWGRYAGPVPAMTVQTPLPPLVINPVLPQIPLILRSISIWTGPEQIVADKYGIRQPPAPGRK